MSLLFTVGCSPYQLTGIVAEGNLADVMVVYANDSRLNQYRVIQDAEVELTLDPRSMSPKMLGTFKTDDAGRFTTTIGETGAGFLEYDLGMLTTAKGYKPLYETLRLPGRDKVLLILLEVGDDTYQRPEDLLEETQRIGEQLMR